MTARKLLYILLGQLYRATFQLVFNVIGNAYWYCRIILSGRYFAAQRLKQYALANRLHLVLEHSAYKYDGLFKKGPFRRWPTWTATALVMIYRAHVSPSRYWVIGNCQDFAHLARVYYGSSARIRIFCPMRLADIDRVHYIADVWGAGTVSNTEFRAETPDQCAARMLDGADYVWIQ